MSVFSIYLYRKSQGTRTNMVQNSLAKIPNRFYAKNCRPSHNHNSMRSIYEH